MAEPKTSADIVPTTAALQSEPIGNIDAAAVSATTLSQTDPQILQNEQTPSQAPNPHSKPCDLCQRRRDVLIRCRIDDTKKWYFVCTGKCWQGVSGGNVDGGSEHPHYKYGGTWRNKHDAVSGKIKGKAKADNKALWNGTPGPHRRHGHFRNRTKKELGVVEIGDDDGASDIEVSDLSEFEDEVDYLGGEVIEGSGSRIQVVKPDV